MIALTLSGTFAYFYTEIDIKNLFSVETYNTISYENFESPNNWIPSSNTTKEVFAKNLSNHEVIARVSYTEKWISESGLELPNSVVYCNGQWLDINGKDYSPMINDNNPHKNGDIFEFAIKHFQNSDWVYSNDGYYYYQKVLKKDETSSAFLGSVEFNPYVTDNLIGVDQNGNFDSNLYINGEYQGYVIGDKHSFSYVNSSSGYSNARYYLTIKVEFTDATPTAMMDIFHYNNTINGGAETLYNLLVE